MSDYDPGFEEMTHRVGEGTEFAATLTCLPIESENGWQWSGLIRFDDDTFNLVSQFDNYDGTAKFDIVHDWWYPHDKTGGAHLMGLLEGWWQKFCEMFERVRAKRESAGG